MADHAGTTITITDAPDDEERAVITDGLRGYNEQRAGSWDGRPLAILARDPETRKVVGGLLGRTSLGLLRVDTFFLPELLRRGRLGSRILAMAEEEGRRRGCTRAVLSTLHFQAPGFYQKQGWEVAARIECEPPGHTRFYMTKKLSLKFSLPSDVPRLRAAKRREKAMQIVDAQIHLWGSGLPSNLAHRQATHFTPEEAILLMDEGGVDAAVIHPPGWDPNSHDMAFAAVRNYPGRFAIMGSVPLDRPESRARIANWRQQPGMLGLRYGFLGDPARQWLHDGTLDWLWAAAEDAGVPIAALATDSLTLLGRIAQRHPGLRLTIDHLGGRGGTSTLKDAAAMTHMPELVDLAKFPNVAVKATGVPHYSSEPYPFPALHIYLRQVYDAFGPNRMFWGTDITKMPCSWRQCVAMFTEELPWLSDDDKRLIMGEALCAWWGWDRAKEIPQ